MANCDGPWLILRGSKERSFRMLTVNQPLALGYYMKEELRLFREQPDREAAMALLKG